MPRVAKKPEPPVVFCHGRCVTVPAKRYAGKCRCPCRGVNHGTYTASHHSKGDSFLESWFHGYTARARMLIARPTLKLAEHPAKNRLPSQFELRRRHRDLQETMAAVSLLLPTPGRRRAVG